MELGLGYDPRLLDPNGHALAMAVPGLVKYHIWAQCFSSLKSSISDQIFRAFSQDVQRILSVLQVRQLRFGDAEDCPQLHNSSMAKPRL